MKLFWAIVKITGAGCVLVAILGYIVGKFGYILEVNHNALPFIDGNLAVLLSGIGIAMFLPSRYFEKQAVIKSAAIPKPLLDINNLAFIEQTLRRTRRRNLIMGFSLTAFAVFMIWVPWLDPQADPSSGGSIFLYCFGGLILVLSLFMIYKGIQFFNVQETEIYKTIMLEPKTITALNGQLIQAGFTKHTTHINAHVFVGERTIAILSVSETELELLRQYLMKHNPNLRFNAI